MPESLLGFLKTANSRSVVQRFFSKNREENKSEMKNLSLFLLAGSDPVGSHTSHNSDHTQRMLAHRC